MVKEFKIKTICCTFEGDRKYFRIAVGRTEQLKLIGRPSNCDESSFAKPFKAGN
jgi:hypothetical protein